MPGFLFDTNVWLAMTFAAHPLHAAANGAFTRATPDEPALFCRSTQQSVLRLTSDARLAAHYGIAPLGNQGAMVRLDLLMGRPNVGFADEPPGLFPRWKAFADLPSPSPKRWMDAYLAAFAVEAGLTMVTADGDFNVYVPDLKLNLLK